VTLSSQQRIVLTIVGCNCTSFQCEIVFIFSLMNNC